jgi:hypothetical protein
MVDLIFFLSILSLAALILVARRNNRINEEKAEMRFRGERRIRLQLVEQKKQKERYEAKLLDANRRPVEYSKLCEVNDPIFLEWLDCQGTVQCSLSTASGKACKHTVDDQFARQTSSKRLVA